MKVLASIASTVLVALLAACADAPGDADAPLQSSSVPEIRADAATVGPVATIAPATKVETPDSRYALVIFRDRAVHRDLDQVDAIQGGGYPALRVFVYARGVPRKASPVADVKPVCHTPTECEYLPSRRAGFAERYTVSLDGDAPVELRAVNDEVVIAPHSLGFQRRTTVIVRLVVPGSAPLSTRIVYGPATG